MYIEEKAKEGNISYCRFCRRHLVRRRRQGCINDGRQEDGNRGKALVVVGSNSLKTKKETKQEGENIGQVDPLSRQSRP